MTGFLSKADKHKFTMTQTKAQLILASSSPYRRLLLEKLGLEFITSIPDVDETPSDKDVPEQLVRRLSIEKSRDVARRFESGLVIGSDQVASVDGIWLSKPGCREVAIRQLELIAGRTVNFHTGVCVTNAQTGAFRADCDHCRVTFRHLTTTQIERYITRDKPFDCAGSFKSEGFGITLIDRIEGEDPNALVGLTLIRLVRLLESFGLTLP